MADHTFCPALVLVAEQLKTVLPDIDLMVYVSGPPNFELGVRPIPPGLHPCDAAQGLHAPDHWVAFGFVVNGSARHLDGTGSPRSVRTTYLVDRMGHELSVLRDGEDETLSAERVLGRIPDACWRVLGSSAPLAPAKRVAPPSAER